MNFVFHPLTLVTFFPLVGVLVLLFLKQEQKNAARWTALITSLITFGISIAVLLQFNPNNPDLQQPDRRVKKLRIGLPAYPYPGDLHAAALRVTYAIHAAQQIFR